VDCSGAQTSQYRDRSRSTAVAEVVVAVVVAEAVAEAVTVVTAGKKLCFRKELYLKIIIIPTRSSVDAQNWHQQLVVIYCKRQDTSLSIDTSAVLLGFC